MTTTTTPASTSLPTLTPIETDAAIAVAWGPPDSSMLQIAAKLQLAPSELKEILERPHVVAYTSAARQLKEMREDIVARHEHITTLNNLASIAGDREADVEKRLRAGIAVLHGVRAGPTLPSASRSPQLPSSSSAPRLLPAPAKPPPAATARVERPAAIDTVPKDPPGILIAQGGPGALRPGQQRDYQPTPDEPASAPTTDHSPTPATTPSATPITLHHAAGAPRTASSAHSGHPP